METKSYFSNIQRIFAVPVLSLLLIGTSCQKTDLSTLTAKSAEEVESKAGGGGGNTSTSTVTFSGRATVVKATVLGTPIVLSDTKDLPGTGGALNASLLTADEEVPGSFKLEANVLHAATLGMGDRSRSAASVADLVLTVGGNTISAAFLRSTAFASCGGTARGTSEIAELVINGTPVLVAVAPNTTIALPTGGTITINEQIDNSDGEYGSFTVNALHVIIPGVADVIIASAHADIKCTGSITCNGGDFITGGGWIGPNEAKRNFGVAGGIKNGKLWGHLTFLDHATPNIKVKSTEILTYTIVDATKTRTITGNCEINDVPGKFTVTLTDNGEPGRSDIFDLTLSTGYKATGTLVGGNIQLHRPCK
jgi:hypothetical protein